MKSNDSIWCAAAILSLVAGVVSLILLISEVSYCWSVIMFIIISTTTSCYKE
jgi:hypothetical protein